MPAILQRASTGYVSKNDSPRPALEHQKTNRLSSFLGKIRPGHHKDRSSDDSQTSSASSTITNSNDPPRSTPVKRATYSPSAEKDASPSISRKPLPSPTQTLADSGVIYPQQQTPSRKEASPTPKSAMRRNDSSGEATHDSGMSGIERVLSNESVQTTKTTESRAGSTARIRFAQNYDGETDADGAYRPRPRRNSSTGTRGRRSSIYYREHEDGDYEEGVDAGVGSKARRLSLYIPDQLVVDECRLEEHFNAISRMNKKKIGEGGAAEVQIMKSKTAGPDARIFAVKEFRSWDDEEETKEDYIRKIKSEYAISKACDHPNIVATFHLCRSGQNWFHVMQYCDLGDLCDLIGKRYMTDELKDCMFKQLVRGVDYLHSSGIAHRDLKSENLLVTHDGCLKIADFGTSEVFNGTHPGARNCRRPSLVDQEAPVRMCQSGMVGSKPYMAPEIIEREQEYDPRCVDVWSCAIVYLSLHFIGTPWEVASMDNTKYATFKDSWDEWLERHPGPEGQIAVNGSLPAIALQSKKYQVRAPGALHMIFGMLHPDPARRWKIHDAVEVVSDRDPKKGGPWPCCQQAGYSDDIKMREKKVMHNHVPPDKKDKRGNFKG
jgi:protein-serine/threonine kinase